MEDTIYVYLLKSKNPGYASGGSWSAVHSKNEQIKHEL
jgi:hypothetical protein